MEAKTVRIIVGKLSVRANAKRKKNANLNVADDHACRVQPLLRIAFPTYSFDGHKSVTARTQSIPPAPSPPPPPPGLTPGHWQDKTRQDKTMFYLESYTILCISTLSK